MWKRAARRRINAVATRLGGSDLEPEGRDSIEAALARLERMVDAASLRLDAAHGDLARAVWALESIPQGVVIFDETGSEVFRNEMAHAFTSARHAEVLVEQAIQEALAGAIEGR